MDCTNVGQKKEPVSTNANSTPDGSKTGIYKSQTVKETEVVVCSDRSKSEISTTVLPHRLIEGLSIRTLSLDGNDDRSKSFNEVVRRIKLSEQHLILEKISKVSEDQVQKIIQCCDDPSLLMNNYLCFFKSTDFPYVALRALRDGKINVNEFSTLLSLHGIYIENSKDNAAFEMKHKVLFDKNGEPNKESWKAIETTLQKSNDNTRTAFRFDVEATIKNMQIKLKSARLIEVGFWHYDMPDFSEEQTIADVARSIGTWALSRYDDQEMLPSLTMRQALVDSAFGEEAHRINPVIGVSSPDDLRQGGLGHYRDFALPFPGNPLPKTADYLPAPTIADFQHHDFYHLLRVSLLTNKDASLYIAMGDALHRQRDRYDHTISKLKALCREKLKSFESFKERIDGMSSSQKKEAIKMIEKDFYKVSQLISYLRNARRATGQLKFNMYDLEMFLATHTQDQFGKDKNFEFHLGNIIFLLNQFPGKKGREFLNGMPSELAGRAVLPMISGSLDSASEKYDEITARYDAMIKHYETMGVLKRDSSDPLWQEFERSKKFIAYLKSK